jgi:curved DNA-binding protein CbpA
MQQSSGDESGEFISVKTREPGLRFGGGHPPTIRKNPLHPIYFAARTFRRSMPDYFAILQQPRRPWLDSEALKERFHRQTAELHPDVAGGGDDGFFAALNASYTVLRDPASRLRHLLELEAPERLAPPRDIPPALADLFMRIAGFRRALDIFSKKESAASSALARALLAGERLELSQQGGSVRASLEAAYDVAMATLRAIDSDWQKDPRPSDAAEHLAALHHQIAYLSKWRSQLTEALFQFHA